MDYSLRRAAREGNVGELDRLIHEDGNVLKRFDEVEFIDTPLHIAADANCIEFAMEIMSLKPSFARKLNPKGLTPLHLAIERGHKELVLFLLQKAKELVRVEGKKGATPLHYLITRQDENIVVQLLPRFLDVCPESIRDLTIENQTALHVAVRNNKEEALKILCKKLSKTNYCRDVVNQKDIHGDTALHIAARNNLHQIINLLLEYKANKLATNHADETVLDVAQQYRHRESIRTLGGCFIPTVSTYAYKLQKQFVKYVANASSTIFNDMDNISSEDRNALLVILGLLLTSTYQASVSPPGGVTQGGSSSSSTNYGGDDTNVPGKSVMDHLRFLLFYIPTSAVFLVTFFLTLGLLKHFPSGFRAALQILLAFLAICFYQSIFFLAPTSLASLVINVFSLLVFFSMTFMCIAFRVSKISVLILGCWLLPMVNGFTSPIGNFLVGCLSFLFLYDQFWKGSALVTVSFLLSACVFNNFEFIIIVGCWFFLNLCRFCIKQFNERCSA